MRGGGREMLIRRMRWVDEEHWSVLVGEEVAPP